MSIQVVFEFLGIAGSLIICGSVDSQGDEDIQNQERPGSRHYLSHDLDDGDNPADGLLHLYPGPGVHLR